jgi:hypothetical protein
MNFSDIERALREAIKSMFIRWEHFNFDEEELLHGAGVELERVGPVKASKLQKESLEAVYTALSRLKRDPEYYYSLEAMSPEERVAEERKHAKEASSQKHKRDFGEAPASETTFLVSCVGKKLDHAAPAMDLYVSSWFKKARKYVNKITGYEQEWWTGMTDEVVEHIRSQFPLHLARSPYDPERTPRHLRKVRDTGAQWARSMKKENIEVFRKDILELLSDGQPRTFNRIGVELYDKTADALYKKPVEDALWGLAAEGKVSFTPDAPILWFLEGAEEEKPGWFVLSAEHGLVEPYEVIEPYDLTLKQLSKDEREEWAADVFEELMVYLVEGETVVIFAGKYYREYLEPWLEEAGFDVRVPLRGRGIGEQMHWFDAETENPRSTGKNEPWER